MYLLYSLRKFFLLERGGPMYLVLLLDSELRISSSPALQLSYYHRADA